MSLESNIAELVKASNALTGTVNGKIADIDRRVDVKIQQMEDWRKENTPERRIVIDFTIGGSKDFFYPVWWRLRSAGEDGTHQVSIVRNYAWNGAENERPLNVSTVHQAGLLLEMEGSDVAWGGDAKFLEVKRFSETYNPTVSHVSHAMYCKQYRIDVNKPPYNGIADGTFAGCNMVLSGAYLRGGGLNYRVISNLPLDFGFHDGKGEERELGRYEHVNTFWLASPIALTNRVAPPQTLNAFVDAPTA